MNIRQLVRFFFMSVLVSISLSLTLPRAEAWQAVSAGTWHTCGLRNDSTVACWGNNLFAQATPPCWHLSYQLDTGFEYSCGVQDRRPHRNLLTCWGDNSHV